MNVDIERLKRFSDDRAVATDVLFAARHPQASPEFHTTMVDLWRSVDPFVLFEAFRGAGKTTKAEEHVTLEGAFGNFHYGLIVGETYSKACQRLEAIDKLAKGEAIEELFGGPVLARRSIENRVWFASGALLEAWGWEQELQSFKYQEHRPDLVWLDDIENAERVRDRAAVDAGMRKLELELVPALDQTRRRVRYTQTRRAEDCMVTRLAKAPDWLYFGMPICSGEIEAVTTFSNWPERYSLDWIREERARLQSKGMLSEFLLAYMLQAVNPESKPFKEEMFSEVDLSPWQWLPRFAIYDPSRTTNERRSRTLHASARTGKVVVSRLGSRILVHESLGAYWQPSELLDDIFSTQERQAPAEIGVEKDSLDQWLLQPLRIEMLKRGIVLPLKTLNAPQDRSKDEFIMGLQPFFEARDIVLVGGRSNHPQLVAETVNFPHGPRDVLNALAYSMRMFAGVAVYEDFSGANIAEAPEPRGRETVYVGMNASPSEVVAVALLRDGRRLSVARDFARAGALADAVKTLVFEVKASFPQASLSVWVPADTYDQAQRIALVPALRAERLTPYRAEHAALARGCLSERIRTTWRNARLLMVDRKATHTLNALSSGYAFALERGERQAGEPKVGPARLIAEALECLVASLDGRELAKAELPKEANIGVSPGGQKFITSAPRRS